MKVKVGDMVLITAGKDSGKSGKVQKVFKKTGRIIVDKVNIRTKHVKKSMNRPRGEKIKYEAPISAANIMIICPSCSKAVRVGYLLPEDGKKYRVCKKCKASLDSAATTAKKK